MNISRSISAIINQLGLYGVNLPFEEPTEVVIHNVLKTETIPEYSQLVPCLREETVNLAHLTLLDRRNNIYQLPDSLTITPVMSVIDVAMPLNVNRGMYGDISTPFGVSRSIQGVLAHQAYSMLIGQARAEPTFEFLEPNKIRLYGFPRFWVTMKVSCEHDENGESIPSTCYDSFMQLAKLDTRIFLWNNLKLYDGVASAYGTINLKVDEHQGAESERNALLEEWRQTWHLDMPFNWTYM